MKNEKLEVLQEVIENDWRDSISSMEYYIEELEKDIDQGTLMNASAIRDWCQEIESLLLDLSQNLFSLDEPEWLEEHDREQLEELKRKVDQLHDKCKTVMQRIN
jgi:hypothetical protein